MPELVTIYIPASVKSVQVSSTAVRELLGFNRDVKDFVPEEILPILKR